MISGIDHIAVPMENVPEMLAFYASIGTDLKEEIPAVLHSVYIGANKINLHLPRAWQSSKFTLRAPTAIPGCADLCFVWDATLDALLAMLQQIQAKIIEGPVNRIGGRRIEGTSMYIRDPDQNLIEFIVYDN